MRLGQIRLLARISVEAKQLEDRRRQSFASVNIHTACFDLSDAVYALSWSFLGGPPPVDPGPVACEVDQTDDDLTCDFFAPCDAK